MTGPVVEYLHMDGYAFYVWGSYATVLVVLALNVIAPSLRLRRMRRALSREIRAAEAPDSGRDGDDRFHAGDPSRGSRHRGSRFSASGRDGSPR